MQNMNQFYCYLPAAWKGSFHTENLCMFCSIWLKQAFLFNLLCVFDLGKYNSHHEVATCELVFMRLGWHGTVAKNERKTNKLLKKHELVWEKRLGTTTRLKAILHLKPHSLPRFIKTRPVPFAVRPVWENGLGTMTQFKAKLLNVFKVTDSFFIRAIASRTM